MALLKYLSYEIFGTKVGLAYALISSLMTGIISHIVNSDGGIDVGVIGLGSIIGGACAPIALGAIIGALRKTSKPGAKKSTNIKQSIFYTALVMSFLILFSQVNSDKSDGFYKSDNAILEDIAINNYEAHMCEKNCETYGLKINDLLQQAKMRGISHERTLAALQLGKFRAYQERHTE